MSICFLFCLILRHSNVINIVLELILKLRMEERKKYI